MGTTKDFSDEFVILPRKQLNIADYKAEEECKQWELKKQKDKENEQ